MYWSSLYTILITKQNKDKEKKNTVCILTQDLYGLDVVLYSITDKQSRTEHL